MIEAILARHGVSGEPVKYATGSVPVYAIGEHVLKLFPPHAFAERDVEATALAAVAGRLPVPTPAVEAIGEHDGWGYVLMQRLQGESLATAWPRLDGATRLRLVERVGELLAALHALAPPALGPEDWDAFVAAQRETAVERQRKRGLDEAWLAQIPAFLAAIDFATPRRALLHTEVMREHLLLDDGELSGLFDFEPAMVGAPEYELAAVGIFVTGGEPGLFPALMRAYGVASDPARLLGYALVHRYSNLKWYLERMPASSLEELAGIGWA